LTKFDLADVPTKNAEGTEGSEMESDEGSFSLIIYSS